MKLRWLRTARRRNSGSIYIPGGAEWPNFYLTLQMFVGLDEYGEAQWVDVAVAEDQTER